MESKTGQFAKKWEDLTFTDNFIFCKVMKDENLCRELLERLLGFKISRIVYPEPEKTIIPQYESKGIRMDLYVKDDSARQERIFDVEIQTYSEENLEKRVRFYQSVIDIDNLQHGMLYKDLPESYIIFICTKDPFKQNIPVYETKTVFKNNGMVYNDGTHKIFYNAESYEKAKDKALRNFLRFISTQKATDDFTSKIDEASVLAKQNILWRKEYMFLYDIIEDEKALARETGHAEGFSSGFEEGRSSGFTEGARNQALESAKRLLKNGIAQEIIIESTGLTQEELKKLQE